MSILGAVVSHPFVFATGRILGLALLAALVTAGTAFFYRVRTHQRLPEGVTVLLGLGAVAIVLNTRLVLVQTLGPGGDPLTVQEAYVNVAVFVAAGIASYGGRHFGDRFGTSERLAISRFQPEFSPLVRAVGRFITVSVPDEISDIDGYDPVDDRVKDALAGSTLDFPRGLTRDELDAEVRMRLREEHGIGYVDLEMTDEGEIEHLGVGRRAAGLGPTIPPGSAAVALRADPPYSATVGDTVQIWGDAAETESPLGTGELRATVGDVVTVVTDVSVAEAVNPTTEYRLMTLPADSHPEKEFAALLREVDETLGVVELGADSPLVGTPTGAIDIALIAITGADGVVETLPDRKRVLEAGDTIVVIGRPEELRILAEGKGITRTETSVPSTVSGWEHPNLGEDQ